MPGRRTQPGRNHQCPVGALEPDGLKTTDGSGRLVRGGLALPWLNAEGDRAMPSSRDSPVGL